MPSQTGKIGDDVSVHEIRNKATVNSKVKVKPKVYTAERIIGNGSFGVVYKALEDESNLTDQEK